MVRRADYCSKTPKACPPQTEARNVYDSTNRREFRDERNPHLSLPLQKDSVLQDSETSVKHANAVPLAFISLEKANIIKVLEVWSD